MFKKIYLRGPRPRKANFYSCPIFLILFCSNCFAQTAFEPFSDDTRELSILLSRHEAGFKDNLNKLPVINRKNLSETFTLRWARIREKFEEGEIYTAPAARQYLDKLVARIKTANPQLQNNLLNCYFSRSAIPNASSMGEGIIFINLGLVSRLQNEDQLAFVVCHEIAHSVLAHSDRSINDYVSRINSKQFQDELRTIKKQSYGKRESLEQLTMQFSFDSRRHTRQHETMADSMAIEFMHNASFDPGQGITALELLNAIDDETIDMEASLTKIFDHPSYPFQKRWIKKESGFLGGHATLQQHAFADSLKTHPDCNKRIAAIRPRINKLVNIAQTQASRSAGDIAFFESFKERGRYETIAFDFKRSNYSGCLFSIIKLIETKPADPYLALTTGKCLNQIYAAIKNHSLSKVTDLPSPGFAADYNLLCQFIQKLYPENVAAISYYFLLKNKDLPGQTSAFHMVFDEASRLKMQ